MFKIGEKVVFIHNPHQVYVTASISGNKISVYPVDNGVTKYIDVSSSLFISNRVYLRRKN